MSCLAVGFVCAVAGACVGFVVLAVLLRSKKEPQ
jgi:hypothetical protein